MMKAAPRQPRSLLIVDDCPDTTASLALLAQVWGFQVHAANDGATALQIAAEHSIDIAVLDIGMPNMTGWELAQRLRQLPGSGGALLVALTGYGREDDCRCSLKAGFDLHLTKPVDPEALRLLLATTEERTNSHVPERNDRLADGAGSRG